MKRIMGRVRTAYSGFLLHTLQVGFGCADVFNALKEAHPWPSIALSCAVWLVLLKRTNMYIKIRVAIFILGTFPNRCHESDV